jgi:hypothetical protein
MTDEIGHVGCAPAGTIADGAVCTDATMSVGSDSCIAGDLCIAKKCKPICDPQLVAGAGAGACDAEHACLSYQGVFAAGEVTTAGVCEPGCDPLTQRLLTTGAEACGSVDPTMPTATCVPADSQFSSFACAPTFASAYPKTDRTAPLGAFANSCAPGFIPFYPMDFDSGNMTAVCSGLCAALKVDAEIANTTDHNPEGDKTALGKLVNDPAAVAGNATCAATIKGSDAANGEDCRYIWPSLVPQGTDLTMVTKTKYTDTLGACFAFAQYFVDDDGNAGTPEIPDKSCRVLPVVSPSATDAFGSAADEGCYSLTDTLAQAAAASAARKKAPAHRMAPSFRVGFPPGAVARHIFD